MRRFGAKCPFVLAATTSVLCLGLSSSQAAAAILFAAEGEARLAQEGLEALHAGDCELAERLLGQLVEESAGDPVAPLLRMKLWWWSILEGRAELEPKLQADFERVRELADQRLRDDSRDVRALYALGEAHCTLGRLHGLRGEAWAALSSHRAGTPLLERALAQEPDLVEPLASLGVYHYYAARAPGFLRFLARMLRVEADRERGLQELWRAASSSGVQQAEAAFYLLEILCTLEDDALEALPLALRMQARYPNSLPFTVSLASVHLALGRPDLGVQRIAELHADKGTREALAARFFLGRTLCASGRAAESLELFEDFTSGELSELTWLGSWHAYYQGLAYVQLGRDQEAARSFRLAPSFPDVADSHSFAKRELERHRGELQQSLGGAEAALAWDGDLQRDSQRLQEALSSQVRRDADSDRRARYALGLMALRLGEPARAAELLRPLVARDDTEEAWLLVRPRLRLLQALLWSGQLDEARALAASLRPHLNAWGSNRLLGEVVRTCLEPPPVPVFEPEIEPRPGEREVLFRFKDVGATSLRLVWSSGRGTLSVPMRLQGAFWKAMIPLPPGEHLYRFEVESELLVPDPESPVRERDDGLWSVRLVEPWPDS